MCGITAIIGKQNCSRKMLESLKQLQNRGYDSAGISVIKENKFITKKFASKEDTSAISKLEEHIHLLDNSVIGISHTRWATHGPKTDVNSHPHISFDNKFCLVHNGIIENYKTIRKSLEAQNITFTSQTDSEIIVNLIAYNYNNLLVSSSNDSLKSITQKAINQSIDLLEGTWGLAIMNIETPNVIYCARRGSPLLVSINENYSIITSEKSGFCGEEYNYIILNNHDLCTITFDKTIKLDTNYEYISHKNKEENFKLTPYPYPHWTIKEIYEQPESVLRALSFGGRLFENSIKLGGLESNVTDLENVDNIILLGCGTSYYAACLGKHFLIDLCEFNTVQVIDGADFSKSDIPKIGKTILILLSQSGETKDLHRCIEIGRKQNLFQLGIVNVPDSLIAREVDCGCYINAGREIGVASTKSFTSQVIILSMISIWFSQLKNLNKHLRNNYINSLRSLSFDIKNIIDISHNKIKNFAKYFVDKSSLFILGKCKSEFIAKEAALKIKEICYIHAEGYSSSSLKHGPFALLEKNFPVIIIGIDNEHYSKIENAYEEIKSRYAKVFFITDKQHKDLENLITIPKNPVFSDLLSIVPLQLLAYEIAIAKNINPDMPKNLAKVVTVE